MMHHDELFGKEWAKILKPFLDSEEFKKIGRELQSLINTKKRIYPVFDNMFRAFRICPPKNLIAVFLTTNSYESEMDGLAFSAASALTYEDTPPVLKAVLDGVEQDIGAGLYLDRCNDLKSWSEQGILLLNCSLSMEKGHEPSLHIELWKPFIEYVVKLIADKKPQTVWALFGKDAAKYEKFIDTDQTNVWKVEHPMIAVIKKRLWKHQNIFSSVGKSVNFIHDRKINWIQ